MSIAMLLEGFNAEVHPRGWHGRFRVGDRVRVDGTGVKGHMSLVGRVLRPSDAHPDTHVVIAPEGGGPHVLAKVSDVRLETAAEHAQRVAKEEMQRAVGELSAKPVGVGDRARPQLTGQQIASARGAAGKRAEARIARERPNPLSSSSRERGLADIEAGRRSDRPAVRPDQAASLRASQARRPKKEAWKAEPGREAHFASELTGYIGKGKIVDREKDTGNLHVLLNDGRRGRVRPDQAFKTRKEAITKSAVPQSAGWSDVAKLNAVGRPGSKAHRAMMKEGAVLDALLENFSPTQPRGFHGRWVRTGDHHELRILHGSSELGRIPADDRTHMMIAASNVIGRSGRTISTGDVGGLVDRALREMGPGGPREPSNIEELRRAQAQAHLRGPGASFASGDHVTYQHGMFGKVPARVTKVTKDRVHISSPDKRVSDTSMTHNQAAVRLEQMTGPQAPRPRLARGQTAQELRGGIQRVSVADLGRERELRAGGAHREGDKVHVVNPQGKTSNGVVQKGAESYDAITSKGTRRQTTVRVKWDDGEVSDERPQDLRPGHRVTPAQPFSNAVRSRLPQGERQATAAQQRQLDKVLVDIQKHTPDYSQALGVVRWHLARANVKRAEDLSSREHSLLLKDLRGLAKHGPGALESAGGGVGILLEAFAAPAPRETPAQSMAIGARQTAQAQKELSSGAWNASKHPRGRGGKFGYTTGGKRATRSSKATSRTVGVGSRGALVASVQRQLGVKADGVYGQQTRQAVARYQQQHHLTVDGVIGRQTIAALRGHLNPQSIQPGPISSKAATLRAHPLTRKSATKKSAAAPVRIGGGVVV